ncbi:alpha/beta hydrolase [Streptomyces yaizuensis]|uniref:Alpha/beta hydrolase n=1 Tax=Streptomyces yaizuensis TaxID=2989713 RepID=A0ABQ5P4N1_9ACTN|nr:alpha/beta hydrolase [Streptomyces sp. YSPA8]GLF97560.1 alpha/beta hydrolase [Streptomyces sp. YSPA8]
MDLATLKALKPTEYENAADGYRALADTARASQDRVENVVAFRMRDALEGAAADAAQGALRELAANFRYTQSQCGAISTALNGFAHEMAVARRSLEAALADAGSRGFTVGPDGTVAYPAGADKVDGKVPDGGSAGGYDTPQAQGLARQAADLNPNPHAAAAQAIADRIAGALAQATAADEKWAPHLRFLKADDDLTVSARDWADTATDTTGVRDAAGAYLDTIEDPPKGGSPAENAQWWKSLTEEQRGDLLAVRPASVGALDGLPATVRDEANRTVLAQKQGQYQAALDLIPKPPSNQYTWLTTNRMPLRVPTAEYAEWERRYGDEYERLAGPLNGMIGVQDRLNSSGVEGLPEAYLLAFSDEGTGRMILANGNPDTADHTAVYVPGTTTNLSGIEGDISRMTNLWQEANGARAGSVSTITWLGYDPPQSIPKDSPFSHYANDGAPAFNRFLDGLETSRTVDTPSHTTVIGHSYGSTLIGSAARQGDLNADDVIFAGSPGVQVGSAREMDVPEGHVWNQEAPGDLVPDVGGISHGGSQSGVGGGVFLTPSHEPFGAQQMTTGTEGHSDYWKPGSTSLWNQAQVVAGRHGSVKLED